MAKKNICKLYLPTVRYCSEHAFESWVATYFFFFKLVSLSIANIQQWF